MATQYNISISFIGYPPGEGVGLCVLVTDSTTGAPVTGLNPDDFVAYSNLGQGDTNYSELVITSGIVLAAYGASLPGVYAFDLDFDPVPPGNSAYPFAVSVLSPASRGRIQGEPPPPGVCACLVG